VLDLAELCDHLGKLADARRFRELHAEMARIVNDVAWDGAWYARAYDDEGRAVGVSSEERHRIGLNTQTWAVIGEVAPNDRARKAMDSAHEKLDSPFGLALMWPPYLEGNDRVRGTTTYPPGAKENGGIFCHAHSFAIVAAARLGLAERALLYYREIAPFAHAKDVERMKVEPYVFCGNIASREHKQYGYGRNAWLSGTATWAYVAATQWILGIRPTIDGLVIDPCIPLKWKSFKVRRIFRRVTYTIEVRNPQHVHSGISSVQIDGKKYRAEGVGRTLLLPVSSPGSSHRVVVVLGHPGSEG